jgi:hypothetical protein
LRPTVPAALVTANEALRRQVLCGEARPAGLSAVARHGLIDGMASLARAVPDASRAATERPSAPPADGDGALVRLLANMVLQAHFEVCHVY